MTKKLTRPHKSVGRPEGFRSQFIDRAFKLTLLGLTQEELAAHFEVSLTCLKRWMTRHPEFGAAIKEAGTLADAELVGALRPHADPATARHGSGLRRALRSLCEHAVHLVFRPIQVVPLVRAIDVPIASRSRTRTEATPTGTSTLPARTRRSIEPTHDGALSRFAGGAVTCQTPKRV